MGFPYRLNTRDSVVRLFERKYPASSGQRSLAAGQCPLCGVERTLSDCLATSQFDPKPTSASALISSRYRPGDFMSAVGLEVAQL
jgi:hypothetical protein